MKTELLGIIGNNLFIAPFYGGDHEHMAVISEYTKRDLIERGVKEFTSRDHIDCQLYGCTIEEYRERQIQWAKQQEEEKESANAELYQGHSDYQYSDFERQAMEESDHDMLDDMALRGDDDDLPF